MATPRVANPYDYVGAVKDPSQFAGREEEINTLREELSRLAHDKTQSPIVAIVGERRVGKTSLMFRAKELSTEMRIVAPMISLTSTTGSNDWEFWRELLEGMIYDGQQLGFLGAFKDQPPLGFRTTIPNGTNWGAELDSLQFATFS